MRDKDNNNGTRKRDKMKVTFEMNGKAYETTESMLNVLRSIVPEAKKTGDSTAVQYLMALGLQAGRISEIK